MSELQFNSVLLEISNQLSAEQLDKLKFLCRDMIGKRDLENINTGTALFRFLSEKCKLSADNTECVCGLLAAIQRQDLCEKLNNYESQAGFDDNQPDAEERAKLDIATEVIADKLGRNWRKLGRKLGLKDVKLESISRRHPTELDEMVRELLKEWRKSQGAEARTEKLIQALRACDFNLTADNVEDALAKR